MKLISASYTPGTGESIVKIGNKYGTFEGRAKVHNNEKHVSNYAGCYIAELRAWLKYFQTQLSRKKAMLKATETLKKDISVNCYENEDINHRINLAIRDYTKEISDIKKELEDIRKTINEYIKRRDEILKK